MNRGSLAVYRRGAVIGGIVIVTIAAACQKSEQLLPPTPTAMAESLFVIGTVRDRSGVPVAGAQLRLTMINSDQSGTTLIGNCSGMQLGDPVTSTSNADGSYIIRFRQSTVRPQLCIAVQIAPPSGSALTSTIVAQQNAFPYDRVADTLLLPVVLTP